MHYNKLFFCFFFFNISNYLLFFFLDVGAEASVPFHQHVFLERHLEGRFPDKGPVKAFMRLVSTF